MSKSVYSLLLTDAIVAEIDRLAYNNGTSRSNMVNQILAEHISFDTPEKRMREIFSEVERLLTGGSNFQTMLQPSDSMFSLRSALSYKYNPTVRYSVELYRAGEVGLGELRVSVRSQNSTLRLYMLQFFKLWTRLEQMLIGTVDCAMNDEKYVRRLHATTSAVAANAEIGEGIAAYIRLFDAALKVFFDRLDRPQEALSHMETLYQEYLKSQPAVL